MPPFLANLNLWDLALIIALSLQATAVSYVYQPILKAFIFALPLLFTFATLAVNKPIDVTNVAGLFLLLAFMNAVRILHRRLQFPLIPAIITSALAYVLLGGFLRTLLPLTPLAFWTVSLLAVVTALLILRRMPPRTEPGQRTALPIYLKLPLLAVIITILSIKSFLAGFLTTFPVIGMISCYEARNSLWTLSRQLPLFMLIIVPMMDTIYLLQLSCPIPLALAAGWAVYFLCLYLWGGLPRFSLNARPAPAPVPVAVTVEP